MPGLWNFWNHSLDSTFNFSNIATCDVLNLWIREFMFFLSFCICGIGGSSDFRFGVRESVPSINK